MMNIFKYLTKYLYKNKLDDKLLPINKRTEGRRMNMKKKSLILITLLLGVLFLGVNGQEVQAQNNQLEEIQSEGVLRMGTSGDYPPYEFYAEIDGERQLVGLDVFIAEEIAEGLGAELEIEDMSFDGLLPALEAGQIDMILAAMSATPEREKSVAFSIPYFEESQAVLVDENLASEISDISDLEGMSIGVQSGSLQENLVNQIPNPDVVTLTNINDLVLALNTGRIDAILISMATGDLHAETSDNLVTVPLEFEEGNSGNAVAMNHGEEELVQAVNDIITNLQETGQIEAFYNQSVEIFAEYGEANEESAEEGSFIGTYWEYFWDGTKLTLFISIVSVFLGMILGSILALMRMSGSVLFRGLATAYVEFLRGTPLMIQVMFIYFGSGVVYPLPALTAGILAVSLNSGAYICEIIRSGLASVDKGQTEAARSLGMSSTESLRHIIFPQALKNIWPSLGNEFITIIKESSIVSVIGVGELIFQSRVVRSISFEGILPLFVTMIIYFILTYTLTKLLNYMEGRMNYDNH